MFNPFQSISILLKLLKGCTVQEVVPKHSTILVLPEGVEIVDAHLHSIKMYILSLKKSSNINKKI